MITVSESGIGTDSQFFEREERPVKRSGGRPRVDRDEALLLFAAEFSIRQVAKGLKCSKKTAGRIRRELIAAGKLEASDGRRTVDNIVEADFDEECTRAVGYKFSEYLRSKRKNWRRPFAFCMRVWENVWDRPSLVVATKRTHRLGEQLAMKFLNNFGNDRKRMRCRKKLIRTLFTFLGRRDVMDKHLTMSRTRDPEPVKVIPEISMVDFPVKLVKALEEFEAEFGRKASLWVRAKLVLMARTGESKESRGLKGLSRDSSRPSYLVFSGNSYRGQVFDKDGETWPVEWLPEAVKADLSDLYREEADEPLFFGFSILEFRRMHRRWKEITKRIIGVGCVWHDLRKVSITWLYALDIPLKVATMINVGWKDLSTADNHYLHLRGMMRRTEREAYAANIPEWFKDGLEEFRAN
jgi:hypothetical protein